MKLKTRRLLSQKAKERYARKRLEMTKVIGHPPHYTTTKIEPIDVTETWGLDFHLGNVIKYIARIRTKGDPLTNLEKAQWYLARRVELEKRKSTPPSSKKESASS